jgi:hypothetical protein
MTEIPIISLWQPWASLIFVTPQVKCHETRSRPAPLKYLGGYIGIHATTTFPPLRHISAELHELCMDVFGCGYNHTLPRGVILGTAYLSHCFQTDRGVPASHDDKIAGDWSPGRFAWLLDDVAKLPQPIPAKGKQGWWKHSLTMPKAA